MLWVFRGVKFFKLASDQRLNAALQQFHSAVHGCQLRKRGSGLACRMTAGHCY